jgi:tellurite methyltransferase
MSMETYDDVYSRSEFYWGREPNSLCKEVVTLFPNNSGAKVIDLGCGEGKDIIHFAKCGFEAVGVDISLPGLMKAEKWASEEGLSIRTIQENINNFRLNEMYDAVYSSGTLTFLKPSARQEIFENYKRFTKSRGINAFNVFVEKPFIPTPPDWGTDEYFYRSGELLALYWDWEIIDFREFIFDCNSSGVPHRHAMEVMIARKR